MGPPLDASERRKERRKAAAIAKEPHLNTAVLRKDDFVIFSDPLKQCEFLVGQCVSVGGGRFGVHLWANRTYDFTKALSPGWYDTQDGRHFFRVRGRRPYTHQEAWGHRVPLGSVLAWGFKLAVS